MEHPGGLDKHKTALLNKNYFIEQVEQFLVFILVLNHYKSTRI